MYKYLINSTGSEAIIEATTERKEKELLKPLLSNENEIIFIGGKVVVVMKVVGLKLR